MVELNDRFWSIASEAAAANLRPMSAIAPTATNLLRCRPIVAMGHVWTAPSWQGKSSRRRV